MDLSTWELGYIYDFKFLMKGMNVEVFPNYLNVANTFRVVALYQARFLQVIQNTELLGKASLPYF